MFDLTFSAQERSSDAFATGIWLGSDTLGFDTDYGGLGILTPCSRPIRM